MSSRTLIECEKYQSRNYHPPGCCDARQSPARPSGKLTVHDLPFDLQPDEQEEKGHQAIIDPMAYRKRTGFSVQQLLIARPQWRVRDDKG